MFDSIVKVIIGDLDEKQVYHQVTKRAKALPKDYRYAFRKIKHYLLINGVGDLPTFLDLLELFETSAADGRKVLSVIGSDVGEFCDEFMRASSINTQSPREKLNKEIAERFHLKEG